MRGMKLRIKLKEKGMSWVILSMKRKKCGEVERRKVLAI